MTLTNVTGALNYANAASGTIGAGDLDIFTDSGAALSVTGGAGGFDVDVTPNVGILVANAGPAAVLSAVSNVDLQWNSLTSTNSAATGVSLTNVTGTFLAPSGSSITNAGTTDFLISGGTANVTYGGTITDDQGQLVSIASTTAGTKSFTGAITDGNDGDGSGISLTTNTGATITFSGGVVLSTGGNPAFAATGGGTLNVCDENPCNPGATGAAVNSIATTTATALNVASTTIGSNNLEFQSISSSGGSGTGIIVDTTGSSGGLKVKGTGTAGSGGTIANKSGADGSTTAGIGVYLKDTNNVSLDRMLFNGPMQNFGLLARNVNGFALANSTFDDAAGDFGNNDGLDEGPISFGKTNPGGLNGLQGTGSLTSVDVEGGVEHNVQFYNQSGSMTLNISGLSSHDTKNQPAGADGMLIEMQGTATATVSVTGSTFANNFTQGIQGAAIDTATLRATVQSSTFTTNNEGIVLNHSQGSQLRGLVQNNTLTGHPGASIVVSDSSTSTVGMEATITGNNVTSSTNPANPTVNHSIIAFVSGTASKTRVKVISNTVDHNTFGHGILVDTPDAAATRTFHAIVNSNNVTIDSPGGHGNLVQARQNTVASCVAMQANTGSASDPAGGNEVRVRENSAAADPAFNLARGSANLADPPLTVLMTNNPDAGADASVAGTVFVINGPCEDPLLP